MAKSEAGFFHILILLLVALIAAGLIYFFLSGRKGLDFGGKVSEPTISLQTQYKNPFDKSAQYVNPFRSYKNPLDNLKR